MKYLILIKDSRNNFLSNSRNAKQHAFNVGESVTVCNAKTKKPLSRFALHGNYDGSYVYIDNLINQWAKGE